MRQTTVGIPLYLGSFTIIQSNDFAAICEEYDLVNPEAMMGVDAISFKNTGKGEASNYIAVFSDEHSPKIIAHECLHITNYIFEDRGMRMDVNNDEAQCYLLGWIVEQCHNFLK